MEPRVRLASAVQIPARPAPVGHRERPGSVVSAASLAGRASAGLLVSRETAERQVRAASLAQVERLASVAFLASRGSVGLRASQVRLETPAHPGRRERAEPAAHLERLAFPGSLVSAEPLGSRVTILVVRAYPVSVVPQASRVPVEPAAVVGRHSHQSQSLVSGGVKWRIR